MRIILYTGKGGVGKTSVAAATAVKIASEGKRVLCVSTDAAHSLSDSFGIALRNEAVCISNRLYGMEIDCAAECEENIGSLKKYMNLLLTLKSEKSIESEEILVFPGFEELLALAKIRRIYDKDQYDVIIVDCAPTGETMSLLKFPELLKNLMEKVFPMKKKAAKFAKPIVESTMKIPIPGDDEFDDIERLFNELEFLHKIFTDKEITSIRIVTTPEKIVVKEAKRCFSYLSLFDYHVDAVVVNRIYPQKSLENYFSAWKNLQDQSISDINESFGFLPIFFLELQRNEIQGLDALKVISGQIYGDRNPFDILYKNDVYTVTTDTMTVSLPFADKAELDMSKCANELSISVKNERRVFTLPQKLTDKEIISAEYKDEKL
ncbi:MAG: ArsA family ATPase, partial [Fibrobacter sp.]|nr:ArsA family ATPase [Fibrobacter sp.]